jgi:hypothetical protein
MHAYNAMLGCRNFKHGIEIQFSTKWVNHYNHKTCQWGEIAAKSKIQTWDPGEFPKLLPKTETA